MPFALGGGLAYADGAGGANSAALGGSSGINGGAGGGGGVGGIGGSNANSNVGVGGTGTAAGTGGTGSSGNAVTFGDTGGAGGAGGTAGSAANPTGVNGGNGGTGSCLTCLTGFGGGGGGGGGDGFVGAALTGVTGTITGGSGGNGGTPTAAGAFGADGGGGGGGGAGAVLSGSIGSNGGGTSANVFGGAGGSGGASVGAGGAGFGGGGGSGLVDTGVNLTNGFTITGGAGGAGGAGAQPGEGRAGGAGGAGITGSSFTLINTGTIRGGNGGATGANGSGTGTGTTAAGGAGVQGSSLQIVNGGTIAGGIGGDGSTRANAITFTGGANSLQLQQGWAFTGNVVTSGGTSALILGGDTTDTTSNAAGTAVSTVFSLSQLGVALQGFSSFQKTGASTWALIDATSTSTPWTISAGTLQLGNGVVNGAITGDVVDNATFAFDPAPTTTTTGSGVISGTGQVTQIGTGTTVLTGVNTYTGGTAITAGTLRISADANLGASPGALTLNGGTLNTTTSFASSRATALGTNGGMLDINDGTTLTMNGAIAGVGALTKTDTGTLVLTAANTYTGGTTISNGTLQLTTGSAAGTGTVSVGTAASDTAHGLNLDFTGADTFANPLSGSGVTTVAAGSGLVTVTSNNAGYTGRWQIDGSAAVAPASTTSTTPLGTGTVDLASGGSLSVATSGAFSFNNALTGSGSLSASGNGQAFSFGTGAGSAFQGTVSLSNNTFALSGSSTSALTHATLSLGAGNVTTVGDGNQTIGALTFNGGTAVFDGTAPAQQSATSLITAGSLDVGGAGTVRIDVPNPYTPPAPTPSGDLSLFQQSHVNHGLELVSAASVTGNASGLTLQDQNGNPLSAARNVNIAQGGSVVAIGTYDYALGTGAASDGLYVGYTLNQLALQAGQSLTLTDDPGATGDNADLAAQLTGSGNLVVAANNAVSLSNANNTFTGTTLVQSGTLQANAANVIASSGAVEVAGVFDTNGFSQSLNNLTGNAAGQILLSGGDVLALNGSGTPTTFAGTISGAGSLVHASGTEVLTGANTYTGGTTISGGTLQLGDGSANGSIAGNIVNNATLAFDPASGSTMTESGAISGSGTVQQTGPGITNLTGDSSAFAGPTNVTAGSLVVSGTLGNAGSATNVSSGGTLGGSGTIGGNVGITDGTLAPGNTPVGGGPGTLTIGGDLTLSGASTLDYHFGEANVVGGPFNDLTTVNGNLMLAGTLNVSSPVGSFDPGLYRIISYSGGFSDGGLAIGTLPTGTTASIQTSIAGQVNLVNTTGATANFWDGGSSGAKNNNVVDGGDGTWQAAAGNDNWTTADGSLNAPYTNGAFAIFAAAPGTVSVDDSVGNVVSGGMQFATSGYRLEGGPITMAAGSNVIRVGDGTSAGAGYVATIASTLTGSGGISKNDLGTLVLTGANIYTGGTTIDAGTLQLGDGTASNGSIVGDITDNATLAFDPVPGTTMTEAGVISGSGQVTLTGTGTTVLSGVNTYTGGTAISTGTLRVSADANLGASAGTLAIDGGTLNTTASFASSRATTLGANGGTFDIDNGTTLTMNGAIAGTGALTKTDTGALVLTAANTYAGGTAINAGTLQVSADNNLGASAGALTIDGGTLNTTASFASSRATTLGASGGTFDIDAGTALTMNGAMAGTGALTKTDTGTLVLTAANTYAGGTTISGGTLQLGDGTTSNGSITGSIVNNATLAFDPASGSTMTESGAISGSGTVQQSGPGIMNLTGDSSTFAGTTNVTAGSLVVSGTLGNAGSAINVSSGGTLGGSGTIGGNVGITDGTLSPGNSRLGGGPGTLTIDGDLTLSSASTLDYHFGEANVVGGPFNDLTTVNGHLMLAGTLNVSSPVGSFDPGLYRIISYNSGFTNGGLAIGTLPAGTAASVQTSIAGSVNLVNSTGIATPFWDGGNSAKNDGIIEGGDGIWQAAAGNDNWAGADGALNVPYTNGAFAIFAAAPGTVTVDDSVGNVVSGGMQFATSGYRLEGGPITMAAGSNVIRVGDGTSAGAGYAATIASALTGSGGISKNDLGTLILSGANTYTGGTTLNAGTLRLDGAGTLGASAGATTVSAGTLDLGGTSQTQDAGLTLVSGAVNNGTLSSSTGFALQSGGVSASLAGNGALDKTGPGTVTLTGNNTYTGATTIDGGTLSLGSGGSVAASRGVTLAAAGAGFDLANGGNQTIKNLAGVAGSKVDVGANTLTIGTANPTTFAGSFAGAGGLIWQGSGTFSLTGDSSGFAGTTTITAGTVAIGTDAAPGASLGGNVDVSGGTLKGFGTIGGNLVNAGGTVQPGGSIGTLTVGGNYMQRAGGALVIAVSPSAASQLKVGGTATLDGKLALLFAPGTYNPASYKLLTAQSVSGAFSQVSGTNPSGLPQSIDYHAADVTLRLGDRASPESPHPPPVVVAPTNDTIYTTLTSMALLNAQQVNGIILDRIGQRRAGVADGPIAQRDDPAMPVQLADATGGGPSALSPSPDSRGTWLRGIGNFTSLSGRAGAPGFTGSTGGFLLGYDQPIGEHAYVGAAAGYLNSSIDEHSTSSGTIQSARVALYGAIVLGPSVVTATAGYAHDWIDSARGIDDVGTARENHGGDEATFAGQWSLPLAIAGLAGGSATLTPKLGIQYVHLSEGAFAETGAGTFDLGANGRSADSFQPYFGVALSQRFTTRGGTEITPELRLGYAYETLSNARRLSVFAADGTPFPVAGIPPSRNQLSAGLGLTMSAGPNLSFYASYDAILPVGNTRSQTFQAGLRWKF